jgi:hypothetical protein
MKTTLSRRHFLRKVGTCAGMGATIGIMSPILSANPGLAAERMQYAFNFQIRDRQVMADRRIIRISEGGDVRLNWFTDEALELHLHGYNILVIATPEHPVSMSFRANTAGRFPVSAHVFQHPVLTHLEIYPR